MKAANDSQNNELGAPQSTKRRALVPNWLTALIVFNLIFWPLVAILGA